MVTGQTSTPFVIFREDAGKIPNLVVLATLKPLTCGEELMQTTRSICLQEPFHATRGGTQPDRNVWAFGRPFRLYSIVTLVILATFGALTFRDAPGMAANLPTPWIGVWERINLGVFLLWVVVLAIALLRVEDTARGIVRGTANFSTHAHQRHYIPLEFRAAAADRLLHKPIVVHLLIEAP